MLTQINYLCVDDEEDAATVGYLKFIARQRPGLHIQPRLPEEFSSEIESLHREVENKGYHGLILDLQLNGKGSPARYRAPALVQEIHTMVAENKFPVLPLALWSNDIKLSASYYPDDTSHDLFDLTIYKERLADGDKPYATKIARKLAALTEGYQLLQQEQASGPARVAALLRLPEGLADELDPRLLLPVSLTLKETAVYDQARFIHRQLLATPNYALVDAEVLAARLGLSLDEVPDFDALAEQLFPNNRYQGIFAEGWACWWMPLLEEAWLALPDCPGPLRDVSAEERVACIVAATGRNDLKPARPIELTTSTAFWTICQITRRPLDPMEGYVVDRHLLPWQLTQYVSLHGKLSGGKEADRISIDGLDLERFEEDRQHLKQAKL